MSGKMTERRKRAKCSISLDRYGDKGWEFEVFENGEKVVSARTNGVGEGLWMWRPTGTSYYNSKKKAWRPYKEYKQVEGTAQYSLPNDKERARKKIRRRFCVDEDMF